MKIINKTSLNLIFLICVVGIFYCSSLVTKSYNTTEVVNFEISKNTYAEEKRNILITENNNVNGLIIALGLIATASLLSLALINFKENK